MDITDMIATDGGSKALEALSRKFNLTPEQTRAAVDELAPAVMSGIRGETSSPEGLQGLIAALVNGDHGRYLDGDEGGMSTTATGSSDTSSVRRTSVAASLPMPHGKPASATTR